MQIRDTASIVLYALGLSQPETYTSRVPGGVFYGYTEISDRPVYVDPDNPRDYVSQPTPEFDTSKDTISAVDNDLMVYLPFDGSTNELVNGNKVTEVDTITYENGYFGQAVVLDDGHLVMDNFDPGTESFTVSMWVKSPAPNGVPPIIASRDRAAGGASTGFLLALRRTAASTSTAFTLEWSFAANGTNAPDSYSNPFYLPDDFNRGWFHVTCIVNREMGTISLATDFGEFKVYNIGSYLMNDLTLTNDLKQLVFGDDLSQNYSSKMGLSIDELMIFKGALDRKEVNRLAEYYDKEGVLTIGEIIGTDPTVQLDFNSSIANLAGGSTINVVGTPTYGTGVVDQALLFANDKTFVKAPDIKLGTNDFSAAFWLDINSLAGSTIPIFSTQHGEGGVSLGGTQGITFSTGTKSATGEKYFEFYFANGSKNAKVVTPLPENVEELGWMHVIVTIDRATSTYNLYIDFKLVTSEVLKYGTTVIPATWTADGGRDDSVFTLGDSGSGAYWNNLNAYMDDFMLFDSALSRKTVKSFANYYGCEGEVTISDYVGFDPSVQLDFNGNVINNGTSDATFDDTNMNYVDSPFGSAADFTSTDQNKTIPEYWANSSDLVLSKEQENGGYNDLTFSFWLSLKTDMVKYHEDGTAYSISDYISENGAAQWMYGDRILFATHDYSAWSKDTVTTNDGMNIFLYAKPTKIKAAELPAYLSINDFVEDSSGYLTYSSGEFAGEYIYRQRLTMRFRVTHEGAMYGQQTAMNIYAPLNSWTNIVMIIDRGEYGVDDAKLLVYQDGQKLDAVAVSYYNGSSTSVNASVDTWNDALLDKIADYATFECGKGFKLNDDVGHYPRDMESYLDEFVIFDRALTEEELAKLAEYYEKIKDSENS